MQADGLKSGLADRKQCWRVERRPGGSANKKIREVANLDGRPVGWAGNYAPCRMRGQLDILADGRAIRRSGGWAGN